MSFANEEREGFEGRKNDFVEQNHSEAGSRINCEAIYPRVVRWLRINFATAKFIRSRIPPLRPKFLVIG
ncbi:hypothetical protein C4572_00010 [Candidatus Parcubacteria bacterium]|nr:MAG: hypothetical protein C4572_00010 [Candidatus Parcubacteria bacterium]